MGSPKDLSAFPQFSVKRGNTFATPLVRTEALERATEQLFFGFCEVLCGYDSPVLLDWQNISDGQPFIADEFRAVAEAVLAKGKE